MLAAGAPPKPIAGTRLPGSTSPIVAPRASVRRNMAVTVNALVARGCQGEGYTRYRIYRRQATLGLESPASSTRAGLVFSTGAYRLRPERLALRPNFRGGWACPLSRGGAWRPRRPVRGFPPRTLAGLLEDARGQPGMLRRRGDPSRYGSAPFFRAPLAPALISLRRLATTGAAAVWRALGAAPIDPD